MAQVGDLVKIDIEIEHNLTRWYGCLYRSEEDARNPSFSAWGIKATKDDIFLVVGRSASRKGKKSVNGSNKVHLLQLVNLRDKLVYWTEPKYVLIHQRAEKVK